MIEELRVSLFAQELGTAHTVSEKRIRKALKDALGAGRA
jgi:ATP-dependent helicase HrpA